MEDGWGRGGGDLRGESLEVSWTTEPGINAILGWDFQEYKRKNGPV